MGRLQPKRWKDNANASCEHSFRRVAFIALLILVLLSISRFCLQVPEPCRHSGGRKFRFWTLSPKITKNEDVIFHKKITIFGVSYSELVDRAASHAACMAFESFWLTSPFTLPARLPTQASCHLTRRLVWKFSFVSSRFRHEWTIKSALCEPESSCHFRDFRFVLSIRLAAGSPVQCKTWAANLHIWGSGLGCPALRSFKILNS